MDEAYLDIAKDVLDKLRGVSEIMRRAETHMNRWVILSKRAEEYGMTYAETGFFNPHEIIALVRDDADASVDLSDDMRDLHLAYADMAEGITNRIHELRETNGR